MNRRRFLSLVSRVAAFVPFTRLAPRVLPDCLWGVDTVRFTPKYYSVDIPMTIEELTDLGIPF